MSDPIKSSAGLVSRAIASFVAARQNPFTDERLQTVGASEVGQCARKIGYFKHDGWAVELKEKLPPDTWGAKVRGHLVEEHLWEPALRAAYQEDLVYAGGEQRTLYTDYLSSTSDGLVTGLARDALAPDVDDIGVQGLLAVECKSIDPRAVHKIPKGEHVFQAQVQLGMYREYGYDVEYGLLTYINMSFMDDVHEFIIKYDEEVFRTAKERAARIMTAHSPLDLRAEGVIAGGKECEYCPFVTACRGAAVPALKEMPAIVPEDPQVTLQIASLALAIDRAEADAEKLLVGSREKRDTIRSLLLRANRKTVSTEIGNRRMKVLWSTVKGRTTVDNNAVREVLRSFGVDFKRFEKQGEETDRLTISVK